MASFVQEPARRDGPDDDPLFDAHADRYEQSLQEGLRWSGEGPEYYARHRIEWTGKLIRRLGDAIGPVLDFGCGIGLATAMLEQLLGPEAVWGYDPSARAIERARRDARDRSLRFCSEASELPASRFGLVYCNGVFHHIPPDDRPTALAVVWRSLRPGGWFALWENNPWNPGTRWIMSRVSFDRDAIPLFPAGARRMVRAGGFQVVRTDAWFLFPRMLRWLRPLEALVHRIPLGGQYLVLARKPLETVAAAAESPT